MKSLAPPSEQDSPFYKENEAICLKMEDYFRQKNGKASSTVSGWALHFSGVLKSPVTFLIELKKSTATQTGLWFVFFPRDNLFTQTKFEIRGLNLNDKNFEIKKKSFFSLTSKNKQHFGFHRYQLYSPNQLDKPATEYLKRFEAYFLTNEVQKINYDADKDWFSIEIRTLISDTDYYDILIKNS